MSDEAHEPSPTVSAVPVGIPSATWGNDDGSATGFMCMTDFEYEVGHAMGGNRIYPSVKDLKRNRPCVASCGIVEVRVSGVRIVEPGTDWETVWKRDPPQGIEARSDETRSGSAVGESPVAKGHAAESKP